MDKLHREVVGNRSGLADFVERIGCNVLDVGLVAQPVVDRGDICGVVEVDAAAREGRERLVLDKDSQEGEPKEQHTQSWPVSQESLREEEDGNHRQGNQRDVDD